MSDEVAVVTGPEEVAPPLPALPPVENVANELLAKYPPKRNCKKCFGTGSEGRNLARAISPKKTVVDGKIITSLPGPVTVVICDCWREPINRELAARGYSKFIAKEVVEDKLKDGLFID